MAAFLWVACSLVVRMCECVLLSFLTAKQWGKCILSLLSSLQGIFERVEEHVLLSEMAFCCMIAPRGGILKNVASKTSSKIFLKCLPKKKRYNHSLVMIF